MNSSVKERKRLKYLFISPDTFPPFRVDVSVLFGKELTSHGHEIDFLLPSNDHCRRKYIADWCGCKVWVGKNVIGQRVLEIIIKNILFFLHDLQIFRLTSKRNYDFILIKDKFISGVMGVVVSKIRKIDMIYWLSYPFPEANLYSSKIKSSRFPKFYKIRGIIFKYLLYRIILPCSRHVFVQSEQMKKDIYNEGIPNSKMTPVPMGVQLSDFKDADKPATLKLGDHPKIVYLGTMIRVRRLDFIIRAFKVVYENYPNAKLYMVGDGNDESDIDFLKKVAKEESLEEAVVFTGFLPREMALEYVKCADVCVSPFYPTPILNSTSPTKIIEYMAMGKPVVANNHPEQSLILNQSNAGYLVPYKEEEFGIAITKILKDKKNAERMGINGRGFVEKYRSYKKIAEYVDKKMFEIIKS